ncbi:MAG: tRNA 2-selenouridine synthase [Sulfurimonas sp.]|jgi:tRNA 2-selenouridine synthase|uniref:tRNA 2-selenouridine(34) synthase MnmH n=1 Tax=Sulfurimonas sp. TaxID=2022749 RepID=UPI0039E559DF
MSLVLIDDFLSIVLENKPLLDVRAPVEFEKGAFPTSTNIPILDDKQRHLVGICYKKNGNEAAVKLGKKLVNKEVQAQRVFEWKTYLSENPYAYLYCFRGGQRSGITQSWLEESGVSISRLKGGYKAFRNFLMEKSQELSTNTKTIIIGGNTGSGKTILLNRLDNTVDLEGLAKHRGSSFGKFISSQPSQIDFENALYYKLIQHSAQGHKHLVIEHESRNIGRVYIPEVIFENFNKAGLVILHTPLDERVEITYEEYIINDLAEYTTIFGQEGRVKWYENMSAGFDRIKKRLGSERYLIIKNLLAQSFAGSDEGHKEWIKILLSEYYDPMYEYQIKKSSLPILFEGNAQEVFEFIKNSEKSEFI